MPIELDSGEFDNDSEVENVVEEIFETAPAKPTVSNLDSRMAEMEERLETIQYYKTLLNGGFFTDPPNPGVASKIENEIATFVLGRLDALLNMSGTVQKPRQSESVFSEAEIKALKGLAEPETYKVLTSVVSKVFTKIKEPAPEPAKEKSQPKLATKKVVAEPKKAPAPVVKAAPKASVETKPQTQAPGGKKYKIHVKDDGTQVKMDVTPQARPQGAIQPVPPPRTKREIEMQMEMSARAAAQQNMSMFDSQLNK